MAALFIQTVDFTSVVFFNDTAIPYVSSHFSRLVVTTNGVGQVERRPPWKIMLRVSNGNTAAKTNHSLMFPFWQFDTGHFKKLSIAHRLYDYVLQFITTLRDQMISEKHCFPLVFCFRIFEGPWFLQYCSGCNSSCCGRGTTFLRTYKLEPAPRREMKSSFGIWPCFAELVHGLGTRKEMTLKWLRFTQNLPIYWLFNMLGVCVDNKMKKCNVWELLVRFNGQFSRDK